MTRGRRCYVAMSPPTVARWRSTSEASIPSRSSNAEWGRPGPLPKSCEIRHIQWPGEGAFLPGGDARSMRLRAWWAPIQSQVQEFSMVREVWDCWRGRLHLSSSSRSMIIKKTYRIPDYRIWLHIWEPFCDDLFTQDILVITSIHILAVKILT